MRTKIESDIGYFIIWWCLSQVGHYRRVESCYLRGFGTFGRVDSLNKSAD